MGGVIVITGAAGNVGGKLRRHLEAAGGYALRLIDIDPRDDADIQPADLSCFDTAWTNLFKGADAIVHLAANGSSAARWSELIAPNVDTVLNVYQAAAQAKVRKVVLASSVWASAARADDDGLIGADDPDPGTNAYGATKLFAERVAHAFWASHRIATVMVRLGGCRIGDNLPGPGPSVWEEQVWISNRDTCNGLELAIKARIDGAVAVNLTSDIAGGRWSLAAAREHLGYSPQDQGHISPPAPPAAELTVRGMLRRLAGRI